MAKKEAVVETDRDADGMLKKPYPARHPDPKEILFIQKLSKADQLKGEDSQVDPNDIAVLNRQFPLNTPYSDLSGRAEYRRDALTTPIGTTRDHWEINNAKKQAERYGLDIKGQKYKVIGRWYKTDALIPPINAKGADLLAAKAYQKRNPNALVSDRHTVILAVRIKKE